MILSKRLQKVLDFVDVRDKVADIGADHGYLVIAMRNMGVETLQVVENKIGPLERAKSNLSDFDNIVFSLSDGISDLDKNIDTVTICGMGGLNIVEILNNNLDTAKSLKKIIMQANSKCFELREFLFSNGFNILDEEMVEDNGKHYEIIVARYENFQQNISYEQLFFGPILMEKKTKVFIDYYKGLKNNILEILKNNEQYNLSELQNKLELINKLLEE